MRTWVCSLKLLLEAPTCLLLGSGDNLQLLNKHPPPPSVSETVARHAGFNWLP